MDVFDAATRSRIMRAIKSRDTKPELALAEALSRARMPFERPSGRELPGSPDFILRDVSLAVFCHGCYWHLCRLHYKPPSGDGWKAKMDANRRRDIRVRRHLRQMGWSTMVVWEHEHPESGALRVMRRRQSILRRRMR